MEDKYEIYILAGGPEEEWCREFGVGYKALLPWGGKTIIETMVEKIRKDLDIPITVVGHKNWPIAHIEGATLIKTESKDIMDTIASITPKAEYTLLLTGDSPLVEGKHLLPMFEDPAELTAGLIKKEDFNKAFPGFHKTFIPIKDMSIKLAGAALIKREKWDIIVTEGAKFYAYRKNPAKIVWKMGIPLFMKLITRKLTVDDVVKWVYNSFGVHGKVAEVHPSLGADVDDKEDYVILKLFETLGRG